MEYPRIEGIDNLMKLTAVSILLLISIPAGATTLQEAIDIALENRGDVESAWMTYESAVWASRNADFWFLPSINGQFAIQKNYDIQEMSIPGMGSIPMGTEYSSIAGISVSIPLLIPQGMAGARLASRSEDLSMHQARATRMDAIVQVMSAFYGVLLAEEMSDVSEEAYSISEEGYKLASLRFEAGTISRFELLQSRVAWENRIPEMISAESALENARAGFAVALGQDNAKVAYIDGQLDDEPNIPLPETLNEARELMMAQNPDLQIAEQMRLLGDAGVDMARAAFFPKLVFQTDLNYQAARDDIRFIADDYERNLTASIALQIPLFNGLSDISDYNSARAGRLSNEAVAHSLEQVAELSLVRAWNNLEAARERAEATESTVEQALEGSEIAAVSFEAGMITRLEMDQAFLALTSSRTNHASSLYELRMAEAELMRETGIMEGYIR